VNRQQCDVLVADLRRYRETVGLSQQTQAERIIEFVRSRDAPWQRSTSQGHLTASAWIVDAANQHALLIHHKKLDKWLQPGGHIDDEDASLAAAALREAREETGIESLELVESNNGAIFDVDVHAIPSRTTEPVEPAHFHYDVRYKFVAHDQTAILNACESNALSWYPLAQIAYDGLFDESVRRMARVR
jgi:8-oxo-dGTP pyrophosphatase MutT (NUDIX family)